MELFVWSNGFCYRGKVKDLQKMLQQFPVDFTVKQLIELRLN